MDTPTDFDNHIPFSGRTSFKDLMDNSAISEVLGHCADISLVLDQTGQILDTACSAQDLGSLGVAFWEGVKWHDTVTTESIEKIDELLRVSGTASQGTWRQITHRSQSGSEVPVRYLTVAIEDNHILAFGKSMQAIADLQQQLIEDQVALEREYTRVRNQENRYRLVFQALPDAVLVLEADEDKITEANPAASHLFNRDIFRLQGTRVSSLLSMESKPVVQDILNGLRMGKPMQGATLTDSTGRGLVLNASRIRIHGMVVPVLHLSQMNPSTTTAPQSEGLNAAFASFLEVSPEAFVLCEASGRIETANGAFLDLAQVTSVDEVRGRMIGELIGRTAVDANVLLANLKEYGSVKRFSTAIRNSFGGSENVDVSAVFLKQDDRAMFGCVIRSSDGREETNSDQNSPALRSTDEVLKLVGRVPLKDLVKESTDIVEKLSIEAALELTGGNRASAAEILGISRQSLYIKLRRYGIGVK